MVVRFVTKRMDNASMVSGCHVDGCCHHLVRFNCRPVQQRWKKTRFQGLR